MKTIFTTLVLVYSVVIISQTAHIVTPLDQSQYESSGLIYLNGKIISHNDSGGETALFEIDTLNGNYSRKVFVQNANNVDWEDIAIDGTYIYIGDFGNNQGDRTNLKIYRVLINDYNGTLNDTVSAEVISFNYSDQIDFTSTQYTTNFDAEAMIAFNDTLYVFTKNWGNQKSNIYAIPNQIGSHSAMKIDSLDPQGLISAATYNAGTNSLLLIGYQSSAFTFSATDIVPPFFSQEPFSKTNLIVQNSFQVEGITSIGSNYYMSAEQNPFGIATLYRFNIINDLSITGNGETKVKIYPNPLQNYLLIETDSEVFEIKMYDASGRQILTSSEKQIDCSKLDSGVYLIQFSDSTKKRKSVQKIVKF